MSSLTRNANSHAGGDIATPLSARTLTSRRLIFGSLRNAASFIRYRESLLMQGAPLLGALFAVGHWTPETAGKLGVFAAASVLLVAHVFLMNDWAGMSSDLKDPHRTVRTVAVDGLGRRAVADLGIALLLMSLVLFALLHEQTLLIAIGIAFLSSVYSLPHLSGKGVPLLSSGVHFLGGLLHFLLGYSLFTPIDARGLSIAVFFGLTVTAGHWNHEARDWDGDRLNGIRTNAVAFGRKRIFLASTVLFAVAYAYLALLAQQGLVPRPLRFAGLLYPLQFYASWTTFRAGLSFESVRRLQICYRAFFALIGLGMLAAIALGR